jgi:hypothetical protein
LRLILKRSAALLSLVDDKGFLIFYSAPLFNTNAKLITQSPINYVPDK